MSIPFTPVEVFYSFADVDAPLLEQLEHHLSVLRHEGQITTWHKRQIVAGSDWQMELDQHLNTASLILLLISPAFFASDYCYGVEMQQAMQRYEAGEARVIPLLLRPVDWQSAPFGKLKALPSNGKPITAWSNRDAAFADIAQGIRVALNGVQHFPPSSTLSGIWNVPYLRNPHFTGRDELLDRLDQQLSPEAPNNPTTSHRVALTQPQAIKGLGGIGKTQIAVEYAYRSRDLGRYTHTFWINAADEEKLLTSFVKLADLLPAFPAKAKMDQSELVEAVKRWLEQCQQRWLLIFDNADDVTLVRDYLPQRGNGSILLTTRANAPGSLATSIEVDTMGWLEGTQLLLRRAQRFERASEEEVNQAGNIVVALDHFPLALDQAGAYLEETQCSFADYLDLYQTHRKALLAQRGTLATDYPYSVATTWSLSFQKVQQKSPAAAELLRLCAFLAPDRIPEELIREGAAYWPPLLQESAADLFAFQQMIAELLKFSLVKRLTDDQMLSIHRLVQAVQMDMMAPQVRHHWAEGVVQGVNKVFPQQPNDVAAWPQCLRYLDQVQVCSTLMEQHALLLTEGADLLDRASLYLGKHASYALAEPLSQHAEAIYEQQLGPEHPNTASSLNNLAELYRAQGKYAQAEPLYLRALEIFERVEATHTNMAGCLNNLALLYYTVEKYEEAEPLYRRALAIYEQKLGDTHSDTAKCLNNLANLYYTLGKYEEAQPLYERALASWEQQEGITHPDMALSLNNLAELYRMQERYEEAEPLYQRALEISKKWLGDEHPDTALILNNLAILYHIQGKLGEAQPLYERARVIFEQKLGDMHPDTVGCLSNLAKLYYVQKKYEEAEPLLKRALSSYEQIGGATHPYTLNLRKGYASLLQVMGRDAEARELEENS